MIDHLHINPLIISNWKIFVRIQTVVVWRDGERGGGDVAMRAGRSGLRFVIFFETMFEEMWTLISHLSQRRGERVVRGSVGEKERKKKTHLIL